MEIGVANQGDLVKIEKEYIDRVLCNWEDEPLFIVFVIPLSIPLDLAHHGTFKFARGEDVPWLKGQPWKLDKDKEPVWLPGVSDEGHNIVSMRIWRPRIDTPRLMEPLELALRVIDTMTGRQDEGGSLEADLKSTFNTSESYTTVIEALTPLVKNGDQDNYDCVSAAMDRCIEELGLLTRGYSLATRNPHVRPISWNNIFPIVPWIIQNPFRIEILGPGLLRANSGAIQSSGTKMLNEQQHYELMIHVSNLRRHHPFTTSAEWGMQAKRAFEVDGDYSQTVIAAHTGAESLLDSLLLVMAWEDKVLPEDAAKWFSDGLVQRISKCYADKLKGPWHPSDTNTAVGKWVQHCNKMRHRVVHMGYRPTHSEAQRALDTTSSLMNYIKDRLVIRKKRYPRTALLLLGIPGLERRNALTHDIKKFLKNPENSQDDWIASYQDWHKQFISKANF